MFSTRARSKGLAVQGIVALASGISALSALWGNSAECAERVTYAVTKTIPIGSPERWDFLSFDRTSNRVYIAHFSEITVVDGRSGAIVGHVPGGAGMNGVAIVPEIGKGYTASRANKTAIVFDLGTLKPIKEVPAAADTDAVIYDSFSKRVFIMNGDPHSATVIDTETDSVVATIALGGAPEYAVADGAGNLYVNLTDKKEISRIDTRSAKVSASWPIHDCQDPRGLSMDTRMRRLFSSCLNNRLMVVDSDSGRLVATLPIGEGSDATAFDPKRGFVLSSNGEGTLSVIREAGPEKYVSVAEVRTQPLARTMAIDSENGRVYLVSADRNDIKSRSGGPSAPRTICLGSVRLLFLDPHEPDK